MDAAAGELETLAESEMMAMTTIIHAMETVIAANSAEFEEQSIASSQNDDGLVIDWKSKSLGVVDSDDEDETITAKPRKKSVGHGEGEDEYASLQPDGQDKPPTCGANSAETAIDKPTKVR
jgi:hypothetical protein